MKIIIAPSKTKKIKTFCEIEKIKKNEFQEITNKIVEKIVKFSIEEIEKKFKLKKELAEKILKFYKNYDNEIKGHALASYTGIAFKSIDANSFNDEDLEFAENHLVILSALYGILTPFSEIKEYRLDMVNSIFESNSLYEVWREKVNKYFENEDIIINLSSKEYSKILKLDNIYDFEFFDEKDNKLKQISTNSKKMRGFTVNYIIKNRITDVEKLKNITLNGYKYDEKKSKARKYVYVKKE